MIEKSSDPVKEALTWSEYYKANTMEFLVSSTPDGVVNFISEVYGGRITDKLIVEVSGYLDVLLENSDVMANRGFKHIGAILQKKTVNEYVSEKRKATKDEVRESKRIARLRIHIERVIGRLREFQFITKHSCVQTQQVWLLDYFAIMWINKLAFFSY